MLALTRFLGLHYISYKKYVFTVNFEITFVISTQCKWIGDYPILSFLCFGGTFLLFIHLIMHVFCIKLFSASEIIFQMMNMFSYWPDVFIYFLHSWIYMRSRLIKLWVYIRILITNFHVLRFDFYDIPTYEHWKWC